MSEEKQHDGLSRRGFIKGIGGGIVGTAALSSVKSARAQAYGKVVGPDKVDITLIVNGSKRSLKVFYGHKTCVQ